MGISAIIREVYSTKPATVDDSIVVKTDRNKKPVCWIKVDWPTDIDGWTDILGTDGVLAALKAHAKIQVRALKDPRRRADSPTRKIGSELLARLTADQRSEFDRMVADGSDYDALAKFVAECIVKNLG